MLVPLTIGLACAHVLLFLFSIITVTHPALVTRAGESLLEADVSRYHAIARHPGVPYRGFEVEYPPVTLIGIELLNGSTSADTLKEVGVFCLFLSFGVASILLLGWGPRECATYLGLGVPLALFVYFRLDLLSVFLAIAAFALLQHHRQRAAGATLALAVLSKVWPVVLLPLFVLRRQWSALTWFVLVGGILFSAWIVVGGFDGPVQVATFRHAHGWQNESLVGAIVWVSGATAHFRQGAFRVGSAPSWTEALLVLGGASVVVGAWFLRSRRPEGTDVDGVAMVAAVGTVLLVSPILSPQYVVWLLPWAALAARDRVLVAVTLVVSVLTTLMWFVPAGTAVFKAELLARNAILVALVGVALWRLRSVKAKPETTAVRSTQLKVT
jgi:Glycosyltransferase family 87